MRKLRLSDEIYPKKREQVTISSELLAEQNWQLRTFAAWQIDLLR